MSGRSATPRWLRFAPALIWSVLLLYVGRKDFGAGPGNWWMPPDKLLHLVLYGVLGALLASGWRTAGRRPAPALMVTAGALVGLYDEWYQQFVPSRSSDPLDWIADVIGILAGFVLVAALRRRTRR